MGLLTLNRLVPGLICAVALPLAIGCQSTKKVSLDIRESLFTPAPEPASSLGCMWKKQIAHLPDPTRNGVLAPGMVGMMNLYAADGLPTKADGDLQIMAYDETPRHAGQVAGMAEMWHFDAATLKKKLATKDDRGMDSYLLFLPWPKAWTDVTKVRLQAKYTPKGGGTELHANDPAMSFEFAPQPGGSGAEKHLQAKGGPSEMRGMPDLKSIFKQPTGVPNKEPVAIAAANAPLPIAPATVQVSTSPIAPTKAMHLPADAPQIIAPDAAPIPFPVPPPPPAMPRVVTITPALSPIPAAVEAPAKVNEKVSITVGEGLPDLVIPAAK